MREKKRSSKILGQNMAPMPASKLAYSLQGLEEVSLSTAPQRWSQERCRNCLAKVMTCLKVCHCSAIPFSVLPQSMSSSFLVAFRGCVVAVWCCVLSLYDASSHTLTFWWLVAFGPPPPPPRPHLPPFLLPGRQEPLLSDPPSPLHTPSSPLQQCKCVSC